MQDLLSLLPAELEALLLSVGEPKYRAKQMFPQLHKGLSPEDMTRLFFARHNRLDPEHPIAAPEGVRYLLATKA